MPISQDEVSKTITLDLPDWLTGADRRELLKEIGDYLVNEVVSYTTSGISPVDGFGKFKKLSKDYANAQKAGDREANLNLTGSMLEALTYEIVDKKKIAIGIFDSEQAPKAYNHNVGDTLPKRPFIPNGKQSFDSNIMSGIDELVASFIDGLDYNPDKQSGGSDNGED